MHETTLESASRRRGSPRTTASPSSVLARSTTTHECARQCVLERHRSTESPAFIRPLRGSQDMFEGAGLASWSMSFPGQPSSRACRRIRRDLSLRNVQALEPQRLPRRSFSTAEPLGVARSVEPDPHLVVGHLLPLLANIEGQPAIATAIDGIGHQARANPCGDPLALITGGGGFGSRRRWNRLDRLDDVGVI